MVETRFESTTNIKRPKPRGSAETDLKKNIFFTHLKSPLTSDFFFIAM